MNQPASIRSKSLPANAVLSALTFALLAVSFAWRPRGGVHNPVVDVVQLGLVGGYVALTPVLCWLTWRGANRSSRDSKLNLTLLVLWLLVLVGSGFIHT